ncbi:hypothetical protein P22_3522 [Propionispora sp. 2/2-37]|uniref:hypothetical protein n=1 Tax=Propionispora sp. 2/2-37 TaxID=1677858 RepID=UPI0006BB748A|nr:hypothetical protein [Propionispora sp. 2/2-37]CUH97394.1 hypothetical protein P22_3522 [Propionispora sp. 2/2-37]
MLCVKDHDSLLYITYEDIIKYHGRTFIAGAAMAYKLLELVTAVLGGGVLARDKFRIVLAVQGPGIIDAVEMATRAKTLRTLSVDQQIAREKDAPAAADGRNGKYYFKVTYEGRRMSVWLRYGFVPQEFLDLAAKTHDGTITAAELVRLQQLKEEIAAVVVSRQAQELFHYTLS